MKHFLMLFLVALSLEPLFSSCEKPLLTESTEKNPSSDNANLIVEVNEIEQTPFASFTRTALEDAFTRLNYAVYDEEGTRVKQVNQMLGDDDFGTASFQLDEGDYQVVVVGHSSNGNPSMTNMAKIQFTNAQGFSDTFLSNTQVTIADQQINEKVSLNRIVSLCRFVIKDDYPENVAKMRFYYTGGSGAFDANTGFGCVKSKQSLFFDVANGQKQFDLYTFLHDTEGTIHLLVTAYDADDNVLYEHEYDIPMVQNKITWWKGNYFSESTSSTFTIEVHTEWAGEIHLEF